MARETHKEGGHTITVHTTNDEARNTTTKETFVDGKCVDIAHQHGDETHSHEVIHGILGPSAGARKDDK